MIVAADYPFLEVLWTMLIFFVWASWFVLLIRIIGDVFRRHDISGGKKTLWLIFLLFVPIIGTFAYLSANSEGMVERTVKAQAAQSHIEDYAMSVSGGSAAEIEKAKQLLDDGTITQPEFEVIKSKALASA